MLHATGANILATLILGGYPLVIFLLFSMYRPTKALALSLLVSELILPPGFALPIPYPTWLTKWTLPPITAFVALLIFARKPLAKARPLRGVETSFVILMGACYMTMWTNRDPLSFGDRVIPGEGFGDFFSDMIRSVSDPWAVFFMGRAMFRSTKDVIMLGRMMAIAAVALVLPILIELRFSPQINWWIYGYMPSQFAQSVRAGGYRPQVLFGHGLILASFLLSCLIVSIGLVRAKVTIRGYPAKWFSVIIGLTLVACKSMGALLYAVILVPLLLWAAPKRVATVACVLALTFGSYPILRTTGVIPTAEIAGFFKDHLSADRAQSLKYRFDMEDGMLELARARPWFGWGGYDRSFVHDPVSGQRQTVPDGVVAMTLSGRGFVTFYSYFFPYVFAVVRARLLISKIRSRKSRALLAALSLSCSIILLDLIINSTFFPLFMMLFGVLYALPKVMIKEERAEAELAQQAEWNPDGPGWAAAAP